jgi:hypothetical protein
MLSGINFGAAKPLLHIFYIDAPLKPLAGYQRFVV